MKYALAVGYPLRLIFDGENLSEELETDGGRICLTLEQSRVWAELSSQTELLLINDKQREKVKELEALGAAAAGDTPEELLWKLAGMIPVRQGFGMPGEESGEMTVWLGGQQKRLSRMESKLWLGADGRTAIGRTMEKCGAGFEADESAQIEILNALLTLIAADLYYLC